MVIVVVIDWCMRGCFVLVGLGGFPVIRCGVFLRVIKLCVNWVSCCSYTTCWVLLW